MQKFFGFYWTLPVNWTGFQSLPRNVDEAADASRTIRYQRDYVRRWVKDTGGVLIGERAFLELQPDRGTPHISTDVDRVLNKCRDEDAALVIVDFASTFGWRRHGPLWERLRSSQTPYEVLDPAPIMIDGEEFDPVAHFRAWREIEHARAQDKPDRKAALADTIAQLSPEHASLEGIAAALNEIGKTTTTGKPWTADNLRKFLKSI